MLSPWYDGESIIFLLKGNRMKIKEIIVVEGKNDFIKVQQAVNADIIVTNGSAIEKEVIQRIQHAQSKRGVIVFTDPDYPGQRIRHIINDKVPGCKHAFLTQDQARAKHPQNKSLGIEHASIHDIQHALKNVQTWMVDDREVFTKDDLLRHQLIGYPQSKHKRKKLGNILNIGHTNGKQLLKRLNMFQITQKQFEQAMERVLQEVKDDES